MAKDEFNTAGEDDPWASDYFQEIRPLEKAPVKPLASEQAYNGSRPLIAINMMQDDPDRGDMHGFMGIAEDIARKVSGDVLIIRQQELDNTLHMLGIQPENKLSDDDKIRLIFRKAGNPDFYFTRHPTQTIMEEISASGCGVLVTAMNEKLPEFCGVEGDGSHTALPHHISQKKAEWEGHLFAQEYEDLPRPFIALNLADGFDPHQIGEDLARHCKEIPEATFFVTSCHRTSETDYKRMIWKLEELFPGQNFPVIGFNKKYHDTHHAEERLNPYIGLTAAADHVIVCGYSASMISERISTGRSVITDTALVNPSNGITSLHDENLTTHTIAVQNITSACADALIDKQQKLRELKPGRNRPLQGTFIHRLNGLLYPPCRCYSGTHENKSHQASGIRN